MLQTCNSCCFWNNGVCILNNRPIPEEKRSESFCDQHKYNVGICEICGRLLYSDKGIIVNNNAVICEDCFLALGTCRTCKQTCSLELDNTMPRTVYKTFQQGGMTIQGQTLNPDLIAKHCPSCKCYIDNICYRQEYRMCNDCDSIIS